MTVEVINTGTELLLGHTLNTHLGFLAQELFPLGLRIARQVTVPDGDAIRDALDEAFGRADIILVTGGLGPTTDDITREVVAEMLGLDLLPDPQVMENIRARFARRGLTMTERVARQAQVPRGAIVFQNANGTAPGLYLRVSSEGRAGGDSATPRHLFLLPGPPRELKPMVREQTIPLLKQIVPGAATMLSRTFHVVGMGESDVEALIGEELLALTGLELGYCAQPGAVHVRCIGTAEMLERADAIVRAKLEAQIASDDDRSLEQVVVEMLSARGLTVATAESCTGGFLSHRITNVSGSSAVFLEGFVTYANEAKTRALEVDAGLIQTHGAVSREVAAAMAENACRLSGADFALSTTGIAGPAGGTEAKPVGTVFIGLAGKGRPTQIVHHKYPTDRETFKWLVSQAALDLLRRSAGGKMTKVE